VTTIAYGPVELSGAAPWRVPGAQRDHHVAAGGLDQQQRAASIRFWEGRQPRSMHVPSAVLVRWEKKAENYLAFIQLACAQLIFSKLAVSG
jgi:hypothetical protein